MYYAHIAAMQKEKKAARQAKAAALKTLKALQGFIAVASPSAERKKAQRKSRRLEMRIGRGQDAMFKRLPGSFENGKHR